MDRVRNLRLDILTDEELLKLASHQGSQIEHISNEWRNRYKINFPYIVVLDKVYNCLLKDIVSDMECDKLIVEQANKIRKRR